MAPLMSGISPIASNTRVCNEKFEQLSALFESPDTQNQFDISPGQISDAHGQLRVWAGNIGAFQSVQSASSLDYRVREAPKVTKQIIGLLEELGEALDDVRAIASGERPNRVDSPIDPQIDGSIDLRPSPTHMTLGSSPEIQEIFFSITETITSLFKLSIILRNSSSRDRYAKALAKVTKESTFNSQYDIDHVRNKFPCLDKEEMEWLKIRLGKTITHRRQYLRYCRDHHIKLMKPKKSYSRTEIIEETPTEPRPLSAQGSITRDDETMTMLSKMTGTLASTTATTVIPANIDSINNIEDIPIDDSRSQTSYATSIAEDEAPSRLYVVRLEEVRQTARPFECPYCWTIQTISNQHAWRKHVFQDLKPYLCTFEVCDMKLFPDRNMWFTHELQSHRVEWQCCFCAHPPYETQESFEKHARKYHSSKFTEEQVPALVLVCQRPLDKIPASACPFCDEWGEKLKEANAHLRDNEVLVVTPQQFRHHVGDHMEQLALFAITRGYKDDDEACSNKAAIGHGTDNSDENSPENIEIKFTDDKDPWMHVAAFMGLEDEVRQAIASGSATILTGPGSSSRGFRRIEDKDYYDGTWGNPLSAAAAGGHDNILRLFKDVYDDPGPLKAMLKQKSSSPGSEGWICLHWAASNGHRSTCALLIEYGVGLGSKSADGYTAWDLARDYGHDEVVTYLECFLSPPLVDESVRMNSNTPTFKKLKVIVAPAPHTSNPNIFRYSSSLSATLYLDGYKERENDVSYSPSDELWLSEFHVSAYSTSIIEIKVSKKEIYRTDGRPDRAEHSWMPGLVLFRVGDVVDLESKDEVNANFICAPRRSSMIPVEGSISIRLESVKVAIDEAPMSQQDIHGPAANFRNPAIGVSDMIIRQSNAGKYDLIVPLLVYQCTVAIEAHGLKRHGIYQSEDKARVNPLREALDYASDNAMQPIITDVFSVGELLKQLLAQLPDPLLTKELYVDFIDAAHITDFTVRRDSLRALVQSLPKPHYDTLTVLMLHLNRVERWSAVNGMDLGLITRTFGPLILRADTYRSGGGSAFQASTVEELLVHSDTLFGQLSMDISNLRPLQLVET